MLFFLSVFFLILVTSFDFFFVVPHMRFLRFICQTRLPSMRMQSCINNSHQLTLLCERNIFQLLSWISVQQVSEMKIFPVRTKLYYSRWTNSLDGIQTIRSSLGRKLIAFVEFLTLFRCYFCLHCALLAQSHLINFMISMQWHAHKSITCIIFKTA